MLDLYISDYKLELSNLLTKDNLFKKNYFLINLSSSFFKKNLE